jgi:hypothetical protein
METPVAQDGDALGQLLAAALAAARDAADPHRN